MSEEANISRILDASTITTRFSPRTAFDVAPIVPEAQKIVRAVAYLYWRHFEEQLIGVLVHGSALKGGVIPGCSDIDFRVYVERNALDEQGAPPLEKALALQRALAKIDVRPFQYIQTYLLTPGVTHARTQGHIGPVAGAYHMVYGRLPVPEATEQELFECAHATLQRAKQLPSEYTSRLLDQGHGRLERNVRLLCTDVWPALYSMLVLQFKEPLVIWQQPKLAAMNMLPRQTPLGLSIHRFYQDLIEYYSGDANLSGALAIMEQGILFLRAVNEWYEGFLKQA